MKRPEGEPRCHGSACDPTAQSREAPATVVSDKVVQLKKYATRCEIFVADGDHFDSALSLSVMMMQSTRLL